MTSGGGGGSIGAIGDAAAKAAVLSKLEQAQDALTLVGAACDAIAIQAARLGELLAVARQNLQDGAGVLLPHRGETLLP